METCRSLFAHTYALEHSMTHEELMVIERGLENEAVGLGQARYLAQRMAGGEERTAPGRELIRHMVMPTIEAMRTWLEESLDGKPGPGAGLAKYLSMFDVEDVAFVTCRQALMAMSGDHALVPTRMRSRRTWRTQPLSARSRIGPEGVQAAPDEDQAHPLPNKRYVLVRKRRGEGEGRAHLVGHLRALPRGPAPHGPVRQGEPALQHGADAHGEAHDRGMLVPEADTIQWLDVRHNRCSLHVSALPADGRRAEAVDHALQRRLPGDRAMRLRLIHSRRVNKNYLSELAQEPMPMVYGAINALQATPWRINRGVLGVLKDVWDSGGTLGKLPGRDSIADARMSVG
jgi:DNA-directed RNA polymerase